MIFGAVEGNAKRLRLLRVFFLSTLGLVLSTYLYLRRIDSGCLVSGSGSLALDGFYVSSPGGGEFVAAAAGRPLGAVPGFLQLVSFPSAKPGRGRQARLVKVDSSVEGLQARARWFPPGLDKRTGALVGGQPEATWILTDEAGLEPAFVAVSNNLQPLETSGVSTSTPQRIGQGVPKDEIEPQQETRQELPPVTGWSRVGAPDTGGFQSGAQAYSSSISSSLRVEGCTIAATTSSSFASSSSPSSQKASPPSQVAGVPVGGRGGASMFSMRESQSGGGGGRGAGGRGAGRGGGGGQGNVALLLSRPASVLLLLLNLGCAWFLKSRNVPADAVSFSYASVVDKGEVWRAATASFAHFELMHLGMNMMSVWNLGALEDAYGSTLFFAYSLALVPFTIAAAIAITHVLIYRFGLEAHRHRSAVGYSCVLFAWMVVAVLRAPKYCPLPIGPLEALCFPTTTVTLLPAVMRQPLESLKALLLLPFQFLTPAAATTTAAAGAAAAAAASGTAAAPLLAVPFSLAPFVLLGAIHFFMPRASFVGHLAGIAVGFPLSWGVLLTPSVASVPFLACALASLALHRKGLLRSLLVPLSCLLWLIATFVLGLLSGVRCLCRRGVASWTTNTLTLTTTMAEPPPQNEDDDFESGTAATNSCCRGCSRGFAFCFELCTDSECRNEGNDYGGSGGGGGGEVRGAATTATTTAASAAAAEASAVAAATARSCRRARFFLLFSVAFLCCMVFSLALGLGPRPLLAPTLRTLDWWSSSYSWSSSAGLSSPSPPSSSSDGVAGCTPLDKGGVEGPAPKGNPPSLLLLSIPPFELASLLPSVFAALLGLLACAAHPPGNPRHALPPCLGMPRNHRLACCCPATSAADAAAAPAPVYPLHPPSPLPYLTPALLSSPPHPMATSTQRWSSGDSNSEGPRSFVLATLTLVCLALFGDSACAAAAACARWPLLASMLAPPSLPQSHSTWTTGSSSSAPFKSSLLFPLPHVLLCPSYSEWSDARYWRAALRYEGGVLALAHLLCAAAAMMVLSYAHTTATAKKDEDSFADLFLESMLGSPDEDADCSCLFREKRGQGTRRGGEARTFEDAEAAAFTGCGRVLGTAGSSGRGSCSGGRGNSRNNRRGGIEISQNSGSGSSSSGGGDGGRGSGTRGRDGGGRSFASPLPNPWV